MRFPSIWISARVHRQPEPLPADELRLIDWLLGAGPSPGPRKEAADDSGLVFFSPIKETAPRPTGRLKWWK
jgi:hypothetical protein